MQLVCFAVSFTLLSEGRSIPARIAMMAMTTSNSIRVNDDLFLMIFFLSEDVFLS